MVRRNEAMFLQGALAFAILSAGIFGWVAPQGPRATESIREVPPLEISYNFLGQRKMSEGDYREVIVKDGAVLRSHDNLKVCFRTNEDCYVYVLLLDSKGRASQLFPHPRISLDNRVQGGRNYEIPPGDDWFWLDEETGTETLYLLASYDPMGGLREILGQMEGAGSAPAKQLTRGLELEVESLTRGSERSARRTRKPIHITGVAGRSEQLQITTRGMEDKALKEETRQFQLSDGTSVQTVTQVVKGYASCVKVIRFEHR